MLMNLVKSALDGLHHLFSVFHLLHQPLPAWFEIVMAFVVSALLLDYVASRWRVTFELAARSAGAISIAFRRLKGVLYVMARFPDAVKRRAHILVTKVKKKVTNWLSW